MGAVIGFFIFCLFSSQAFADYPEPKLKAVLFDRGDSRNSVAVLEDAAVELEDFYKNYQVVGFEPDAVIFEETLSREGVKFVQSSPQEPDEVLLKRARHLFVVRQMKVIYAAQMEYFHQYHEGFAPDLETLIKYGLLLDGFENGIKQEYSFQILESSAEYQKEPTFMAMAAPVPALEPDYFFSVDQLGLVRFADTSSQIRWAPVWDYMEHSGGPKSRFLGIQPNISD